MEKLGFRSSIKESFTLFFGNFGEFFTKADSYHITCPQNATPEEKMLLIIDGLMIDYQYFENDDIPEPVPPPHPYYY